MQKPFKDGWEYTLTVPYQTYERLNTINNDILLKADAIAERHSCFIEADVTADSSFSRKLIIY